MLLFSPVRFYTLLLFASVLIVQPAFAQDEDGRRNPTTVGEDGIPGYKIDEDPDQNKESSVIDGQSQSTKKPEEKKPEGPILTKKLGFSDDYRSIEVRAGGSLWIGGPVVNDLSKNIRNIGFDTDYTYAFGNDLQRAGLYSGTQGYSGAGIESRRMGILYDKSVSDHWSVGGGIDYREYRFNNIPNNVLSRSLIIGPQRFLVNAVPEEVERNILFEYAGLGSYSNGVVGNKIVFLEVNATYHFFSENAWDPYLRPIFGLGYDTTAETYAIKMGGASGLRYFFQNGVFLGGELSADVVFMAQDRVIKSQARSRIYEATANFFIGKKFD
ncbi:MAG: hypothetical protein JJT78_06665 [Leptospira sp.]|nr:hypothetical protein [Leptospira sp.]